VDLTSSTFTHTELGVGTGQEAALIDWAKGIDTLEENANSNITEMRPSAHGDVLHSRPVAIDYRLPATNATCVATPTDPLCVNPRVYVFYGSNDGMLHAINGNRTLATSGVTAGDEAWSFVPPEFVGRFKDLRANNVEVDYEGSTASPTQSKPYGMDGPITSYRDATGATTWLFAGMRRGGRAVYAFNASGYFNSSPSAPTLMWKAGCGASGCSGSMSDMGQSWSAPKVYKAQGFDSGNTPVIIMGGGYDACQDNDTPACSGGTGDHIYILDASDGSVEKTFDTDSQVVGDVVMSTDPVTGYVRWGYAADMAGNVYRISGNTANTPIGSTSPGSWTMTKIASLGCATAATCTHPRKFMFAPGVVNENGTYVLMIGSGDREKPLRSWTNAYATSNYMYMLRDSPDDSNWYNSELPVDRCGATIICMNSLVPIANGGADATDADLADKKGWRLALNDHEQVVTTALTVFGTTTFSTHTPVPATGNQCVNTLGTARVYNVSYKNAQAQNGTNNRSEEISGGGLPPSPVAGMVRLDDGSLVPFLIGGDPDSPLQSLLPTGPNVTDQPKAITYWYIQK
jgi:type IV pilus assembly protein PilY1